MEQKTWQKKAFLWLLVTRPKTLVASIIPVSIGACLSIDQIGEFNLLVFFLCLVFALLIQIATNFYNDYYDYVKGADSIRKLGPTRLVQAGQINGRKLKNIALVLLFLAFCLGIWIMEYCGASRLLLLVGIGSVICAFAYTGGPFPLAYNGLGDLFVILFFGLVAVSSTHYVLVSHANCVWEPNWIIPLGVGFMINNLLVVNNYRDFATDRKVGKKTLIVLLGQKFGLILYFTGFSISCFVLPLIEQRFSYLMILWPIGICLCIKLHKAKCKEQFSTLLATTSVTILAYGSLLSYILIHL